MAGNGSTEVWRDAKQREVRERGRWVLVGCNLREVEERQNLKEVGASWRDAKWVGWKEA